MGRTLRTAGSPAKVFGGRKVRESYIELKTTQFAVKIVEFKAPGKKPTKRQKLIHGQLLKQRFKVDIIDGVEAGIKLFDED